MALSDNGASFRSNCCRTTDGAVLSTYRPPETSNVGLGSTTGELTCAGSYIYVFRRFGSDGSSDLVARRCKYTPDLRCSIVFSEPTEVKLHGYKYAHGYSGVGRDMITADGKVIPLILSPMLLGWLEVQPVYDTSQVNKAVSQYEHDLCCAIRSNNAAGVTPPPMASTTTGAAYLQNMRDVCGPVAVDELLQALREKSSLP